MKTFFLTLSAGALALTGGTAVLAQDRTPMVKRDGNGDGTITRTEMQAHGAAMFARMDTNGDGRIDAADRAARKAERFARMDRDGNGEISQAEMDANRAERRERMEQRRAERAEKVGDRREQMFARLDTDRSGGISQAEMDAARAQRGEGGEARADGRKGKRGHRMGRRGMHRGGMMMGMMRQADTNNDQALTRAEFDAALTQHFSRLDTDGNGSITQAERQAAREAMRARVIERRGQRGQ